MPNETTGALLYLHALTPLHPGSGSAMGVVDLPVQRERHTDWPVIPGSSVKGVLRDATEDGLRDALFGKGGENDSYAGAISVTDARLLAFPVRSLKGVFAWVTCPQALQRWKRDAAIVGKTVGLPQLTVAEDVALAPAGCPCVQGTDLILEEFQFQVQALAEIPGLPKEIDNLASRLVVLNDTDFTYFAQNATEVAARIKLDSETKTVQGGALFFQEFVPAESIFYSVVLAVASREKSAPSLAAEVLGKLALPNCLQFGGDSTTGKGLCAVTLEKGA